MAIRTLFTAFLFCSTVVAGDPAEHSVFDAGQQPDDVRLQPPKDLNGYFPFVVPETKAEWEQRRADLKQRILVATGLHPLPERTPLNPVVHGKAIRPGFTIEKFYFESLPGHFVSGLIFRPDAPVEGKRPGILCPHGHGGRLQDYGPEKIKDLIKSGAELHPKSGRFPKLARCAQLAKMGCVVITFDMLGYVDSQQLSYELVHRYAKRRPEFEQPTGWGFFSTQAESRLQSVMGLQTWNCLRALDFLEGLPDVDSKRLAVTGGSGGGTQTIVLCAIDDRPIAGFPQGMVSTAMQGGCTCENCSLLRIGTGNVELAALFAPKPQGMTAADDWTKDMMTKGYPELKKLYAMLDVPHDVYCEEMLQFPHNYNAATRKIMYEWMNKHLSLGLTEPFVETDWEPLLPEEYTVWNDDHPAPPSGPAYERRLLEQLTARDLDALSGHNPQTTEAASQYFADCQAGWDTIIGREQPAADNIERTKVWKETRAGYLEFGDILTLKTHNEQLPVISLYPKGAKWNQQVVLWVDGEGKNGLFENGSLHPAALSLIDAGYSVVAADLFGQGEFSTNRETLKANPTVANPREFAGYTYCYNDTLFVRRIHDILTVTAWINGDQHKPAAVHAIGVNGGGQLLAAAATKTKAFTKIAITTNGFRFCNVDDWKHANFVPGAVKYGDLPTLIALGQSKSLWVGGENDMAIVTKADESKNRQTTTSESGTPADAVNWLKD